MTKIVFTCGDINGIGPEIVIKTINKIYPNIKDKLFFICPANVFESTIKFVKPVFNYRIVNSIENNSDPEIINILDPGIAEQIIGEPTSGSGLISYKAVELSFLLAKNKQVDAIVTAPISKYALSLAGIDFPGHTEMYAKWSETESFVMMFISEVFKGALLTIHEPVKKVPPLINESNIINTVNTLIRSLQWDFNITNPRIAVLGLNPHAGENGRIGDEEERIIKPALKNSDYQKNLYGPFVPDAFFAKRMYKDYDLVLGMYHDQLLIPFKMLCFSNGVNYTAGLPIIRTSPDHGTAFDIADKYIASEESLYEAYLTARKISITRQKHESS